MSDFAANKSDAGVHITWRNPPGTRYTVIRVEEGTPVGVAPIAGQAVYSGSGTNAQVAGLASGSTYTVTAFTVDDYGNISAPSNLRVTG